MEKFVTQVENATISEMMEMFRQIIRDEAQGAKSVAVDLSKPLSVDQAAEFLGKAKQSIYNETSDPESTMPFHKQGGKLYFFRDELIAWIRNEGRRAHKINIQ